MKAEKFKLWAILCLFLTFFVACTDSPLSPTSRERPTKLPWGDEDAELMALCLSGELTAPQDLYSTISDDLRAIRTEFGAANPALNQLKFHPPWVVSCLIVHVEYDIAQSLLAGTYHGWDELNQTYHVTRVDLTGLRTAYFAVLYFEGRLHPRRLAEIYHQGLRGVSAEPNGYSGDGPNIYPRRDGTQTTYLFRDASGDCPSGCISSEYWYFSCADFSAPVLIGHWKPEQGSVQPAWFVDARKNIDLYYRF